MNISQIIAKWLKENNLSTIFGVTGGAIIYLTQEFNKERDLNLVFMHNEQAVSMAAEGWARVKGKPGICLVTVGPGATNALTGVVGAWMDSVPLLIFSGQSFRSQTIKDTGLRQFGIQEADILSIVSTFTKKSFQLNPDESIVQQLNDAYEVAMSARQGPVWIEVPVDVQKLEIEDNFEKNNYFKVVSKCPDKSMSDYDLTQIFKEIQQALRPIFILGNGCRSTQNLNFFIDYLRKNKIPVILTHNSLDFLNYDDEINLGFGGIFGNRFSNLIIQSADLIISIGSRLSLAQTGYNLKDFGRDAKIISIDIDGNENKKPYVKYFKSINLLAENFISKILMHDLNFSNKDVNWLKRCNKIKKEFSSKTEKHAINKLFVNSYTFIEKLTSIVSSQSIFITDMGLSYQSTYQAAKLRNESRLITNTGFASMGWGLPASIGAATSAEVNIFCITGDGGLMMNLQELATVKKINSPIKVFIYNNRGYLTMQQSQKLAFGEVVGADIKSGLYFPNWELIASSFGLDYFYFNDDSEVNDEKLNVIIESRQPAIIELNMTIDQEQIPRAIPIKNEKFSQSLLENPYPFVSDAILKSVLSYLKGRENGRN